MSAKMHRRSIYIECIRRYNQINFLLHFVIIATMYITTKFITHNPTMNHIDTPNISEDRQYELPLD